MEHVARKMVLEKLDIKETFGKSKARPTILVFVIFSHAVAKISHKRLIPTIIEKFENSSHLAIHAITETVPDDEDTLPRFIAITYIAGVPVRRYFICNTQVNLSVFKLHSR